MCLSYSRHVFNDEGLLCRMNYRNVGATPSPKQNVSEPPMHRSKGSAFDQSRIQHIEVKRLRGLIAYGQTASRKLRHNGRPLPTRDPKVFRTPSPVPPPLGGVGSPSPARHPFPSTDLAMWGGHSKDTRARPGLPCLVSVSCAKLFSYMYVWQVQI